MSKLKLCMKRQGGALHPYGQVAWDTFDKIRSLDVVIVTVHQARNPLHHDKFWALATRVANFDRDFDDADEAVRWVKRQIPGMHRRYVEKDGTVSIELGSIAFESMDQLAFNEFYDRALHLWAGRIGCDPETLSTEAEAA